MLELLRGSVNDRACWCEAASRTVGARRPIPRPRCLFRLASRAYHRADYATKPQWSWRVSGAPQLLEPNTRSRPSLVGFPGADKHNEPGHSHLHVRNQARASLKPSVSSKRLTQPCISPRICRLIWELGGSTVRRRRNRRSIGKDSRHGEGSSGT